MYTTDMICEMCGDTYELQNKHGGHPKTRPICGEQRCSNMWTYRARKKYYTEKKREAYFKYKAERYDYIRNINRKAKARQRFGIEDRELFIKEAGGVCTNCGKDKTLIVHHIDGNGRRSEVVNNSPDNLMILCQGCHVGHHRWGKPLKRRYSPISHESVS